MSETVNTSEQAQTYLSVVAPAYNEAENIEPLADELLTALNTIGLQFEILLVDDGSEDGTGQKVRRVAKLHEPIRSIRLSRNFGQSAALAAGLDNARGDIIVTIDADLQNDPGDIPRLVGRLQESDAACVSGNRSVRRDSIGKRLPSRIQTTLAKRTGPDINDFGCTLKAYDADALRSITIRGEGHRYIPAKLYEQGYDVEEMSVNHRKRIRGESKYGVLRLLRGALDLLVHWFWNGYSDRPIHLLGGIGTLMLAGGLSLGTISVIQRFMFGVPLAPKTPRLILIALLLLFGVQLLVFGILGEMIARISHEDKTVYRVAEVTE